MDGPECGIGMRVKEYKRTPDGPKWTVQIAPPTVFAPPANFSAPGPPGRP